MDRRCMGCMEVYDDQFDVCPFCGYVHGTPAKEAYHITPGSVLAGRYIIGRVLGFGGFGITYISYDQVLETKVAIKEYMPGEFSTRMPNQLVVTVYSGEREEQFKDGMLKIIDEARRLAQFQNEPNIVHILDCFEDNNTAYIVMEYLDGESMKELLAREGRLPVEQALDIILKVISALKKVHEVGIIHRDVAPDNIYILKNGDVKVLDFGAARYATTKHSKSLSVIIKPGYAPEEQYRSRGDQGPWTDVYALSATFYKMITGTTPEDAMERSVKDLLKKPSKLGVAIPKSMETAIMNALNVRIEDRTQSMGEFEQELMAAEVKEKIARQRKADVGKIPLWAKITAAAGGAVIIIILVVLLTVNFMPKLEEYTIPEGMTIVPNLVNQESGTAVAMGKDSKIVVIKEGMHPSVIIPANNVISQDVEKGTVVDENSTVVIGISSGKEKVVVPLVEGMTENEAVAQFEGAGLKVAPRYVDNDEIAPGSVVSQSIEGNTTSATGDTIFLEIAKDNGGGDASVKVEVPSLAGMDYKNAQTLLRKDYLYLIPEYEYSDTVPNGMIISQKTEAGEVLLQKNNIRVTVSMGKEKVQMPEVRLTMSEEALKKLESMGLAVSVQKDYSDSVVQDKIISQSVEANEMVEKGTAITLVVSQGPKPVETKAPRKPKPAQTNPAQTNPAQANPAQTNPAQANPAQANPAQANPAQANPAQANQNLPVDNQPAPDSAQGGNVSPAEDNTSDEVKNQIWKQQHK